MNRRSDSTDLITIIIILLVILIFSVIIITIAESAGDSGFEAGVESGYDEGYNDGFAEGEKCGYSKGCDDAESEAQEFFDSQSEELCLYEDISYCVVFVTNDGKYHHFTCDELNYEPWDEFFDSAYDIPHAESCGYIKCDKCFYDYP